MLREPVSRVVHYFAKFTIWQAVVLFLASVGVSCLLYRPLGELIDAHHTIFATFAILSIQIAVSFSFVVLFASIGKKRKWGARVVRQTPCFLAILLAALVWIFSNGPGYVNWPVSMATSFLTWTVFFSAYGRKMVFPNLDAKEPDPLDIIHIFPPERK
jgi:hypothetical protein